MSVFGSGSYFAFDGLIAQSGNLSDGSLTISGGFYSFHSFDTAVNNEAGPASIIGTIDVTSKAQVEVRDLFGGGSSSGGYPLGATVGRSYDADHQAYGRLTISGGADVLLAPQAIYLEGVGVYGGYDTLNAGIGEGGTGIVTVTGAGSSLSTSGANPLLRFGGAGGTGSLVLNDGATAHLFAVQAGFGVSSGTSARGRIQISGAGSRLELGGASGSYIRPGYAAQAGTTTVGLAFNSSSITATGRGYLDVTNDGEVIVQNVDGETSFPLLRFGRDKLSYGEGLVDGSASRLAVIQHGAVGGADLGGATLDVGEAGQGVLKVQNGGTVEVLGDRALLAISRPGDDQSATSIASSLTISSGGTVRVDAGSHQGGIVLVASGVDAIGTLDISGEESALLLASNAGGPEEMSAYGASLKVGMGGQGTVTVGNGGYIHINGQDDRLTGLSIAEDGGTGLVTIDDAALTITSSRPESAPAEIKIGDGTGSIGELIVKNDGSINLNAAAGVIRVAQDDGSQGSLSVIGPGSYVNGGSLALIGAESASAPGSGGEGKLILSDGGRFSTGSVVIGATGKLELSGGILDADLSLYGMVDLSPGTVTAETLSSETTLNAGAMFRLDAPGFSSEPADYLSISSGDPIDFSGVGVALTVDAETVFFGGDCFVFAGLANDQTSRSHRTIDIVSGRTVKLVVEDSTARIEAVLGSPVTLREDGTIKSVALPSMASVIDAGSTHDYLIQVPAPRIVPSTMTDNLNLTEPPSDWGGGSFFDL